MSMSKFTKMLESVGAKYSIEKPSGKNPFVRVPVPGGGYDVNVSFSNNGNDFFTAVVDLGDSAGLTQTKVSDSPTSSSDDYTEIVNMVKNAPVQNGYYEEAKSSDGKYIGLLYQDRDCDYGVAFVCLGSTKQFLGVVGF